MSGVLRRSVGGGAPLSLVGIMGRILRHAFDRLCRPTVGPFDPEESKKNRAPFFYPDLVVVCGAVPVDTALETQNPTLVVEVLSPSTRGIDRLVKFRRYRNAASLHCANGREQIEGRCSHCYRDESRSA